MSMNLLTNIIDLVFCIIPSMDLALNQSRKIMNSFEEIKEKELEKASKEMDFGEISGRLYSDIVIVSEDNRQVEQLMLAKAITTEKWIRYALYYLTNENVTKVVADKETQEFVNGVIKYVLPEAELLYPDQKAANLDKYNILNLMPTYSGKFVLSMYELNDRLDDEMMETARMLRVPGYKKSVTESPIVINPITIGRTGRYDADGMYHPSFLNVDELAASNNAIPTRPDYMTDEEFNLFESKLLPLIPDDVKHFYFRDQHDNWNIGIVSNYGTCVNEYLLDDGTIMGEDDVFVMGSNQTSEGYISRTFVNVTRHPEVASKILASASSYMITPFEIDEIGSQLLPWFVYHHVDMSNTGFLADPAVKKDITKPLCAAVQTVDMNADARFRFESYSDPTHFTLIADSRCKSPLAYTGETARNITVPGNELKLVVSDNVITLIYAGQETKYSY